MQRAELLEAVLADVYGPAKLVARRRLPAAVVAGNPEFLRPLVGVAPPGGAHLHFYAVDRRPRRRTGAGGCSATARRRRRAPGYALENRLALSRAMPDLYRASCTSSGSRRSSRPCRPRCAALGRQDDVAHLPADARAAERDLFRARLSRALSRLPAGRGRGPDGARRRRVRAHRVGPEARRRAAAPPRRRLRRSARAQRRARGSACPAWCRRCATAMSCWPMRSAPASSRRARCSRFLPALAPGVLGARARDCRMSRPGGSAIPTLRERIIEQARRAGDRAGVLGRANCAAWISRRARGSTSMPARRDGIVEDDRAAASTSSRRRR